MREKPQFKEVLKNVTGSTKVPNDKFDENDQKNFKGVKIAYETIITDFSIMIIKLLLQTSFNEKIYNNLMTLKQRMEGV